MSKMGGHVNCGRTGGREGWGGGEFEISIPVRGSHICA